MNIPKYFDGTEKDIVKHYLGYNEVLGAYVMANSEDNLANGNVFTVGSQSRGTQLIKTYKSIKNAQKAFDKMHSENNNSKYVKQYYVLVVL